MAIDQISKDAIVAMSKLDAIEAALRDDAEDSVYQANEMVAPIMETKEGCQFVLQGLKAMLTFMQREDTDNDRWA